MCRTDAQRTVCLIREIGAGDDIDLHPRHEPHGVTDQRQVCFSGLRSMCRSGMRHAALTGCSRVHQRALSGLMCTGEPQELFYVAGLWKWRCFSDEWIRPRAEVGPLSMIQVLFLKSDLAHCLLFICVSSQLPVLGALPLYSMTVQDLHSGPRCVVDLQYRKRMDILLSLRLQSKKKKKKKTCLYFLHFFAGAPATSSVSGCAR